MGVRPEFVYCARSVLRDSGGLQGAGRFGAHAHGIAVILDVVFNHQNDTGPLWQMLPDEAANPYFKAISDVRPNEDALQFFRDMDHWTAETQELIYTTLHMWIDDYHVDGFRYDYTQGIGWDLAQPTKGILGWANRIDQEYNGKHLSDRGTPAREPGPGVLLGTDLWVA